MRRPAKNNERRRSFESDSDDDAFGEPARRDGLIADDRRLGACSDEGAYLGWCRVVLPPSKDTNGSAVDKWEVEVKSEEVEVRHSCSTDGDKGIATIFLVPARSYEIRSRCRNGAVVSASDHKDAVRALSAAHDEDREQKRTAIAIARRQTVYYRRRQDLPGGRSRGQAKIAEHI